MTATTEVEITTTVVTAEYGTLTSGAVLRTGAAYAKHLVEDCAAARYTTEPPAAEAPKRPRRKKPQE